MAEDPTEELLAATDRALCAHGYADLTLRDIAAETGRSKSRIHYHYDTKEELFAAFLTAAVAGGHTRRIAVGRSPARLHASARRYVETCLRADRVVAA